MSTNLLTRRKVAEKLQVSVSLVDKWAKKGILKPLRANDATRTIRFREDDVNNLFKPKKN